MSLVGSRMGLMGSSCLVKTAAIEEGRFEVMYHDVHCGFRLVFKIEIDGSPRGDTRC